MLSTTNSQSKLFDKKFISLTLRAARRCEKCKREYDIKYKVSASDNRPNSSRPVLLSCGHNICENCIYQNRHHLVCAVCEIPIEFEHTRWLKKSYDLNYCLLGQMVNSNSFLTSEPSRLAGLTTPGMLAQESFVQKCSECEQATAIGICMHCKVDFCKRCFISVHQNSKVLKKHKLTEFEMQTLQLQLPKEYICKLHKRLCDRYCADCQGIFCAQCVKIAHSAHRVNPLTVENVRHKDKIVSFLEKMKVTRENIRKALQTARICENRLEDFATDVVLEVNEFFLDLHNHLQLEERRILEEFRSAAHASQKTIHDACAKLADGQTTLNHIRSSLEGYIHKPPHNFHINAVLELAIVQLEQMPCQIQISEIQKNPFIFKKHKDTRKDISNSFEAIAHDPKINIRITPMYGDLACSFEICSDNVVSPEPLSLTRVELSDDYQASNTMSVSQSSTMAVGKVKRTGRVTNIISPMHFFVQDKDIIAEIRSQLANIDENSGLIESVNVKEMYVVYHVVDKAWFRGIVNEELKTTKQSKDSENTKYKTFLLDFGLFEEFPKKWFRKIPEYIRLMPAGAFACGLLDISPNGQEWSSEARELMEEIIQNKPIQVIIQDTTKSPWKVEASILHSGEPISIREVLLYTGIGLDASREPQRNLKFPGTKPTQVSKMKQQLSRPMLHPGEFFRVKITHVENPQQFFAVQFTHLEALTNLETEMELEYSDNQSDMIYYAQPLMCCALFVEEKWYRGCVEEINGPKSIRVRLVDDGRSVTVNWRQLRILKERFILESELSIECSLADVQPMQENAYKWTDDAVAEFVRMTLNPNIQMTVTSSNQFRYQVILNVFKKHLDINIGAMLVKFKHALTTGECSAMAENVRESKPQKADLFIPESQTKQQPTKSGTPTIRTLKRTPVQVIYVKNPGEFYIHLVEHIPGILKFHEELQLAHENSPENEKSYEHINWQVNDHCMVRARINESAAEQWFRGVIISIDVDVDDCTYVVFLRDRGLTIRDLRSNQLTPIVDLFDRVCNAAILSHLACVHPTGGMKTWSHSAIDEFIHNVGIYESLGATIQGATKNDSIPIVLWGMMTESNDPLAPCITKYTNINKVLVCAGLAHMAEKIDITRQLDNFIQAEIKQGQQTLQDWYENFKKTLEELPNCLDNMSEDEISMISNAEISEPIGENEIVTEWLPAEPIKKTVFTAYPTYVDEEAIVYLHDADKHPLLAKMKAKINQEVTLKPPSAVKTDENWSIGQPCLARYHLDNFLYRAVIHGQLPGKRYEVHFVDYGNVEVCKFNDLHRITPCSNIPIQMVRFRIDGILPRCGQGSFSTTVLDLIHGVIVDKLCAIRVLNGEENKEIKRCSIRFDRNDLATYLIQNGFANAPDNKMITNTSTNKVKKGTQLPPWPVQMPECITEEESCNSDDELRQFLKEQICDPTENSDNQTPQLSPKKKTNAMFNPDEYREMFEKMQNDKLYKSVTDADSENSQTPEDAADNDFEDDGEMIELEFSFRSNYWHVDNNTEAGPPMLRSEVGSNFESFDPLDSSSLLSNFSGIEVFKAPQLPSGVTSFYCEVSYARSPTILHVFPRLSEMEYRQFELARRIQNTVQRLPPLTSFETKTPCLARYSKDKLWYRAVIRSHNATIRKVKVFYVDFLNTEVIEEENTRRCPKDLLLWPLRTFEIKLFGLKPNPNMPEKDVKRAVKKCLTNRTLYAKIIRDRGNMMEISLFKSKSEKEAPAYEDLIIQKYFCKG